MRLIGLCLTLTFLTIATRTNLLAQILDDGDLAVAEESLGEELELLLPEEREAPQQIKVVRLRTLHPTLAANTLVELFPDRAEVLHIAAQADLNAIVLRGPEAMVMECVTLVHELDEASAGERTKAQIQKPVYQQPIVESTNQSSRKRSVSRVYGAKGRPVQWAQSESPRQFAIRTQNVTVAQQLHSAELAAHRERLGELSTKFKTLEKVGKRDEANDVKDQIQRLVEEAHATREEQQQRQIEQFEKRLEALKRRLEEREAQRDEIIADAVEAVLTGGALKAPHTETIWYPQQAFSTSVARSDAQPPELALRAAELARNKAEVVRLEQDSKLRALDMRQAEMSLSRVADEVNRLKKLESSGAVTQGALEDAEARAELATIQLERAKVALEMAQKQLKIYRQQTEAEPNN